MTIHGLCRSIANYCSLFRRVLMKKIGFYGGSFDPIHIGHLHLALEMKEQKKLDEVWFSPAFCSPHKSATIATHHRLAMLRLAIEPIEGFVVFDKEAKREGPSYTIDIVKYLLANYSHSFSLLVAEDFFLHCDAWRNIEELVDLINIYIGKRFLETPLLSSEKISLYERLKENIVDMPVLEISSTTIRSRIHEGKYVAHLLPAKILDYIFKHKLY